MKTILLVLSILMMSTIAIAQEGTVIPVEETPIIVPQTAEEIQADIIKIDEDITRAKIEAAVYLSDPQKVIRDNINATLQSLAVTKTEKETVLIEILNK